jgi:EAL domain-containing protein (putative c-di-GMP-specific phosphodiesterase class I)
LGGDEFVLLLENLSTAHDEAGANAENVAHKVLLELNKPYLLNGHEHYSTPSIGVTLFCDGSTDIENLIKHADAAMYEAKEAGRNTVRFYDARIQEMIETRSELENELRHALIKQQLQLYYQVQVNRDGQAIGAEALLRWNHPDRGMVSPVQFIPIAEATGLILPIGKWVLLSACSQLKQWENNPLARNLVLAVNVSIRQFHEEDFVGQVRDIIVQSGINPGRLKLEITESMFEHKVHSTTVMLHELKGLGILFSMDDFGTGYSSMSIIKRLPLDQLKIDQSFVRELVHDVQDKAIVRAIVAMANSMNLSVIAEGVETEEQRHILESKGCNYYQGYLFSKPVPIEQFEELLTKCQ